MQACVISTGALLPSATGTRPSFLVCRTANVVDSDNCVTSCVTNSALTWQLYARYTTRWTVWLSRGKSDLCSPQSVTVGRAIACEGNIAGVQSGLYVGGRFKIGRLSAITIMDQSGDTLSPGDY